MSLIQINLATVTSVSTKTPIDFSPLLRWLDEHRYDFMAPTPASHERVVARADRQVGRDVYDLLGWSLVTDVSRLPPDLLALLEDLDVLEKRQDGLVRSRLRVSRVFGNLFVHSAYPTDAKDSVFLGPDSHRFADFILRNVGGLPEAPRVLDYGAGAGVGGVTAAVALPGAEVTLADVNPRALELADANAAYAGGDHRTVNATSPADIEQGYDLVVTHPPFMIDRDARAYRDGGDLYGGQLSLDWTLALIEKLAPGGRFVMHTGVSIVGGRDVFLDTFRQRMPATGFRYDYRVLDPDIYGDELDNEAYAEVDRIAAIGLRIDRNGDTHE